MPKLSIILPSLNVGNYIEKCIKSVLAQSYQDYEVIVIDAGSTDGTLEILEKYEALDSRIILLHSEKKSYGYQMNLGISTAKGEYIGIVETDDWIEPDMYEALILVADECGADIVKGDAVFSWDTLGLPPHEVNIGAPTKVSELDVTENFERLVLKDFYLWTGVYKKDFLEDIAFNETAGAAYQDIGFLFQTFIKRPKIKYIDRVFYHYKVDNAGASGYNRNAFSFLINEYSFVFNKLDMMTHSKAITNQDVWKNVLLLKLFRQTLVRIIRMAESGEIWNGAEEQLKRLSEMMGDADDKWMKSEMTELELLRYEIFKYSPMLCFELFKNIAEEKQSRITELRQIFENHKDVIVFGSGKYGTFLQRIAKKYDFCNITLYCDNNQSKQDTELGNIRIVSPEKANEMYPNAVYIMALAADEEAKLVLRKLGIPQQRIYSYNLGIDTGVL